VDKVQAFNNVSGRHFIPGLELGRMLYEEAGRSIIETIVPAPAYAASLIGYGSDVLGYDTERSTDHNWGPRFQVFLAPDLVRECGDAIDAALQDRLPHVFHGYSTGFTEPDPLDNGTQMPDPESSGPVNHLIEITTTEDLLVRYLGRDTRAGLGLLDWLVLPDERLLELTAGAVFHDPRGELAAVRHALSACPRDVWLYKLACQWRRIAQQESFVGRCNEAGDFIGMKVVTARLVRDVMKLCFLQERTYAPYEKWLGTAFGKLRCAVVMAPLLDAALRGDTYADVERSLAAAYRTLGGLHNALGITGPVDPAPRPFFDRPYLVIKADRFANALLAAIKAEELRALPIRIGGIDQFIDSPDYIENVAMYGKTRKLFDAH
jgi:hypothetical protein